MNQLTLILQQRYPAKPMYIVGFSLGGNVTLKLLGELGELAPTRNIYGGVAASVPFDCTPRPGEVKLDFFNKIYARVSCYLFCTNSFTVNRKFRTDLSVIIIDFVSYKYFLQSFLKSIQAKAEEAIVRFPDSFDIEAIRNATSVLDYDEHFISKIYGFNNKEDYYKKCCSKFFLSKIRVPAISINARDDPFIREDLLPTCNDIGPDAPVRTIYHEHGGHGGFAYENKKSYQYFGSANTPLSNQEEQISSKHFKIPEYGWLAHEMARAVDHIHHSTFPTI